MILLFFFAVMFVWIINGLITLHFVIGPIMDKYFDEPDFQSWFWREPDTVRMVYEYHEFWQPKAWFGFKHWFFPFKEPTGGHGIGDY